MSIDPDGRDNVTYPQSNEDDMSILYEHSSGLYQFEHMGMFIHNPYWTDCGRFEVSPTVYGFTEWNSGGDIMVMRKECRLENGSPVTLLTSIEYDNDVPYVLITLECDEGEASYSYKFAKAFELIENTKIIVCSDENWW